jgi:hypothetical protein
MQCRDVEATFEQAGLAPLPEAARAHLAGCRHCQEFVADLTAIVTAAQELPCEVEPPARVWISLRAQLEEEGIIKEAVLAPGAEHASWWRGISELFRNRALAAAAVGLVLVAAGVLQMRESRMTSPTAGDPIFDNAVALNQQEQDLANMQLAGTSPVDNSLRQSLRQVDEFIADCERRLKQEPQDALAREYLASAYQQKAELLSEMMDRGGSVY